MASVVSFTCGSWWASLMGVTLSQLCPCYRAIINNVRICFEQIHAFSFIGHLYSQEKQWNLCPDPSAFSIYCAPHLWISSTFGIVSHRHEYFRIISFCIIYIYISSKTDKTSHPSVLSHPGSFPILTLQLQHDVVCNAFLNEDTEPWDTTERAL